MREPLVSEFQCESEPIAVTNLPEALPTALSEIPCPTLELHSFPSEGI